MDISLPPQQKELQSVAKEFAQKEINHPGINEMKKIS